MNPFRTLAAALTALLWSPPKVSHTLTQTPRQNPVLNSIRFGSKFRTDGPPPASYNRRNQRKDRKNFRRKIAAGY